MIPKMSKEKDITPSFPHQLAFSTTLSLMLQILYTECIRMFLLILYHVCSINQHLLLIPPLLLLVSLLVESISQATLAAVISVKVAGHVHAVTTCIRRTPMTQVADFTILVHLVGLQDSQMNLLGSCASSWQWCKTSFFPWHHNEISAQDEEWAPFECCSQIKLICFPVACQQRSVFTNQKDFFLSLDFDFHINHI